MRPGLFVLLVLATWAAVLGFAAGHALVSGRIRMGGPAARPFSRAEDAAAFWTAFALSIGGLLLGGAGLVFFFRTALPAAWAEALRLIGLL